MAHLEVTAGSGRVLAGSVRAADLLDLLAQALQGAVHLQVTVTENVSIISTVHAVGIGGLLLGLGDETKVESATRGTRCSGRSRRSGRTLRVKGEERRRSYFLASRGLVVFLENHSLYMINELGERGHMNGWIVRQLIRHTAGPISPERPRGPGGPVGPGRPLIPSLPGDPADPAGPCKQHKRKS